MPTLRRSTAPLLLALAAACAAPETASDTDPDLARNLRASLSEVDADEAALERSLLGFLDEVRAGELSDRFVDPDHRQAHPFFFDGLTAIDLDADAPSWTPRVLQSYSPDGTDYRVTLAFTGLRDGAPALLKIVELEADRSGEAFRFRCPFERRTAGLTATTFRDVTFHSPQPVDAEAARRFAEFHAWFTALTDTAPAPLDYYAYPGLRELLDANGFEFDATKCNFLRCDLGFLDGPRYQTGSGRADYVFGFVENHLEQRCPNPEQLYGPYVTGLAAYFGGYSLSADDVPTLKRQFREELERRPDLDFLEEFRAGRGASIERHFCHYVMCAFIAEAVAERHGAAAAVELAWSGPNGERFFPRLGELLGLDEAGFHDWIVARLSAPGPRLQPWREPS